MQYLKKLRIFLCLQKKRKKPSGAAGCFASGKRRPSDASARRAATSS